MAYTIEELIAARGTTEPVRQALITKAREADELRAENKRLREAIGVFLNDKSSWFNAPTGYDQLRAALREAK